MARKRLVLVAGSVLLLNGAAVQAAVSTPAPVKPVAPKTAPTAAAKPSPAAGLIAQGDAALLANNTDQAARLYQAALAAANVAKEKKVAVTALSRLADCSQAMRDVAEEEKLRRQAEAAAVEACGADSGAAALQQAELGGMLARKGELALAEAAVEKARTTLSKAGSDHALASGILALNEAALQSAQGSQGMAEESLKTAIAGLEPIEKHYFVRALADYVALLEQLDRKADAGPIKEKLALARALSTTGSAPQKQTRNWTKFNEYVKGGDWKGALGETEAAPAAEGRQAFVLVHLGDQYMQKQQMTEAEAMFKKSKELREKADAAQTLGMARVLSRLGNLAATRKDSGEAQALLSRALDIEMKCGASDSMLAGTLQTLSSSYMQTKNLARGEQVCRQMIEVANRGNVSNASMMKMTATATLGGLYMQSGRLQDGLQLMQQMGAGSMSRMSPEAAQKSYMDEFNKADKEFDEAELKTFTD